MKVIIAEDEYLERKVMKKFMEETFTDVKVVGEAPNGRKAIELAAELQPDFMIVDIKMPGVDGLEAIEEISRNNPSIKFIIASAYDSFEYAKRAMSMGVKEYILKPSKKEETVQAIMRIKKEITQEKEQESKQFQSIHLAHNHFLLKLLQHEVDDSLKGLKKELFPTVKSGSFFVIEPVTKEKGEEIEQFLDGNTSFSYVTQLQNDQFILLALSEEKLPKSDLLNFARTIHLSHGEELYIGVGYPYNQLKDYSKSFYEASKAVHQLRHSKQSHYGFYMEKENKDEVKEELLLAELKMGNETYVLQQVEGMLGHASIQQMQELFFKVKQLLGQMSIDLSHVTFEDYQGFSEWKKFIHFCCMEIQLLHQSRKYIERAKQYIQENFAEQLSLEDVATQIDLSANYFSLLFKEETGQTFVDYVTEIRMNKATELLKENELSLKEISFMIGYKDPNYFSRVFKKYFNISPKQYQKEILR